MCTYISIRATGIGIFTLVLKRKDLCRLNGVIDTTYIPEWAGY
jgi:hypothetical protein